MSIDWRRFKLLCHHLTLLCRVRRVDIIRFHFRKIELLRTKNWTWSSDSDPSDKIGCWEFEMFHCIQTNECSSSTKTSFTVNSKSAGLSFWNFEKFIYNILGWCGTINKKQIWMLYPISYKTLSIVFGFI